jgi:Uma2 family endonuclease
MVAYPIVLSAAFNTVPDDTEESLVGTAGHQGTIHVTYDGILICARRRNLPWFIGNQLFLLVLQEGRDQPRRIAPDIMVYRSLDVPNDPGSVAVAMYGPPALVVEVASPSTAIDNDVNLFNPDAKPQLYARIGVDEYLVFDPTGALLGEPIWARRRGPAGFERWEPEADGRWHSALGISFAPHGMFLRVCDHDGNLVPMSVEFDAMLADRERQLAEQARQNEYKDRRLAELEAELRRLRGE